MNGLEAEYQGEINFYRLDANLCEVEQLQRQLGLRGHPTVAVVNQTEEVVQLFFGAQPAETLISSILAAR